ncbi:Elongation factor 2 [Frankliniella fusca]|uniref:Elongation factor 2 n=1 Tax=Frankliniella fusca TaxID=407009 RepID=A0AAE1H1F2_9NEOP|nr:Elongation factor 2 [Frankliniella fusca]
MRAGKNTKVLRVVIFGCGCVVYSMKKTAGGENAAKMRRASTPRGKREISCSHVWAGWAGWAQHPWLSNAAGAGRPALHRPPPAA